MARPIAEQVIVVTGASSGIGRETAIELARRGARLVLAARNVEALETLAQEVARLGGTPHVVPTDVSDYAQVSALGTSAVDRFGRIDTWVNNASVSAYGTVLETDPAEMRRIIEVNLLGMIHGMKVAAGAMASAGTGTIVNVSSTLARRGVALQAAYCAAKHGIVGFGEALRLELRDAGLDIRVVDVLPSSINTPLFEHARSHLPVLPQPIPPVYEPAVAAEAIVGAIEHPVRMVFAGGWGRVLELAQRLSPALVDWYLLGPGRIVKSQQSDMPDDEQDNLDQPSTGPGRTTGAFGRKSRSTSVYTRVFGLHPNRGRVLAAAGLAGLAAAARRR